MLADLAISQADVNLNLEVNLSKVSHHREVPVARYEYLVSFCEVLKANALELGRRCRHFVLINSLTAEPQAIIVSRGRSEADLAYLDDSSLDLILSGPLDEWREFHGIVLVRSERIEHYVNDALVVGGYDLSVLVHQSKVHFRDSSPASLLLN